MALATLTDLKNYLRVETSAEDTALTFILAQAKGRAQQLIQTPITAVAKTFVDEGSTAVAYGVVRSLFIPLTPVKLVSPAPVVKDVDVATIDATTYAVEGDSGIIRANAGYVFDNGPYTITATVGLSVLSDYADIIEPQVNALILGLASQLYWQRNPNARQESGGGGISVAYGDTEVPPHLMAIVRSLCPGGGVR